VQQSSDTSVAATKGIYKTVTDWHDCKKSAGCNC